MRWIKEENNYMTLNNKEFQPDDLKLKKPIGLYAQKELFCTLNFAVWKKVYGMSI